MKREEIFDDTTEHLFDAILSLRNKKDAYEFFEDLCTIKEIKEMSKRLEAAKLLNSGKNYEEISKLLNISTATLSRISKCIQYGSGGYQKILKECK